MQNPRPQVPPALAIGVAIVAASSASILIRYAQAEAPSLVIAAYRLAIATLILAPVVVLRARLDLSALTPRNVRLTMLAGGFLALHFATWIRSLEFTSVASSIVLVQTAPLMVAALSPLTIREPILRRLLIGLLVATAGSLLVGLSDACLGASCVAAPEILGGPALKGDLLALGGAAAGAGYILTGRVVRQQVSLIPYIGIAYPTAAVLLGLAAWAAGERAVGFSPSTYLWLVLLAVLPQLVAHSTYNWALGYLPAAVVSLGQLGEAVGSTLLAIGLLHEVPSSLRIAGGGLILVGIGLGAVSARRATQTT
jgi:drug/metabolite transporter (DMT)-like permease